ncbi:MAG: ABC transporter permease subunit [Clostridia bacterium]|nr:ABC transporter permease subunit [Clostridia bacterium]
MTQTIRKFLRNIYRWRIVYLMFLPVFAYYVIFHYIPMYGAVIAFKNYQPAAGFKNAEWIGLKHIIDFFKSYYFVRLLKNTLRISLTSLIFGFPAPILLALLLNEVKSSGYKRIVQTVTYFPHFLSIMVVCGMIVNFFSHNGLVNDIIEILGGSRTDFLLEPSAFTPIYVGSGIWQSIGWGSIVYLAALSGIDPSLYEAARIDGANRFSQAIHITLPGIIPTITVMFILRVGSIMNVGYEKIILLYNNLTLESADVISTFIYRKGLLNADYSYSTAVGLFNSVVNFGLVVAANAVSRSVQETSLW